MKTQTLQQPPKNTKANLKIQEVLEKYEAEIDEPVRIDWVLLKPKVVCYILGITRRTLSTYRARGYIPFERVDGTLYYRLTDIQEYLKTHTTRQETR